MMPEDLKHIARLLKDEGMDRGVRARLAAAVLQNPASAPLLESLGLAAREIEPPTSDERIVSTTKVVARKLAESSLCLFDLDSASLLGLELDDRLCTRILDHGEGTEASPRCTIQRIVDKPARYAFEPVGWPDTREPICLVAASLALPRGNSSSEDIAFTRPQSLEMRWAARSAGVEEANSPLMSGKSGGFEWELDPNLLVLDVMAPDPPSAEGNIVVAELRFQDGTGDWLREARIIDLWIGAPGLRRMGSTEFTVPKSGLGESSELTVRYLTEEDVQLLSPQQVNDVLACAKFYLTLPIMRMNDMMTLTFELTELDRERLGDHPSARLFLQHAPSVESN